MPGATDERRGVISKDVRCCSRSLPPVRVMVTLVACFVLELTVGILYSFGNLLPYLTSYQREHLGLTSLDNSDTLWVGQCSRMALSVLMPLLGLVLPRLPPRLQFFIGLLAFAGNLFGSYWAVQQSLAALVIFYGVFQGIGRAVLYPAAVSLALQWVPDRKGLVGGLILAGYGGGALVWNQVVTNWINPHNLEPDFKYRGDSYFTQPEVLSRVPTCFLLLGGIVGGTQLLCILSLTFPPRPGTAQELEGTQEGEEVIDDPKTHASLALKDFSDAERQETAEHASGSVCGTSSGGERPEEEGDSSGFRLSGREADDPGNEEPESLPQEAEVDQNPRTEQNSQESLHPATNIPSPSEDASATAAAATTQHVNSSELGNSSKDKNGCGSAEGRERSERGVAASVQDLRKQTDAESLPSDGSRPMPDLMDDDIEHSDRQSTAAGPQGDYSPLQLIRSRAGWTVCLTYFFTELTIIFVVDLHKAYGLTFIGDDHFLAIVASCAAVFNCVGRPVWGWVADRMGFMPVLLSAQGMLSMAGATFLTVEYLGNGRVAYSLWVFAMHWAISGVYCLQPSLVFSLFGPSHFVANLGLIRISGLVSSLLSVFVASAAKDTFGYHGIFLIGAACTLTGMFINATFLLDCGCALPSQTKKVLFSGRQPEKEVTCDSSDARPGNATDSESSPQTENKHTSA